MKTVQYSEIKHVWPKIGRHILARFDDNSIVVYQAFCTEIAKYAVENGRFGGPKYSFGRMTWIKTNFLWMMYRAGWATKKNQEHVLALTLTRDGFDEILRSASEAKGTGSNQDKDDVRLQWDPDHHPSGAKEARRAIQLGLRGEILKRFHEEWIIKIEDITDFVQDQYEHVKVNDWDKLLVPEEEVYIPEDEDICRHIRLDLNDGNECEPLLEGATGGKDPITAGTVDGAVNEHKLDAVLCLGGAFNPVHSGHIQVMTEVKSWLETNTIYRVIAGILAAAPDGYVRKKSKSQKCIKSGHRIKLCRLACEEIDWLNPSDKPTGSAKESGINFRRINQGKPGTQVIVIVGADRAVNKSGNAKWHKPSKGIVTACIGRRGQTDAVRCKYEEDSSDGRVENDSFYFIPKELENISSTDIRQHISEVKPDSNQETRTQIVMNMVHKGWLHDKVAQYIIQNHDALYLS